METLLKHLGLLIFGAALLSACGGGSDDASSNAPARWARLTHYAVNPGEMRAPATVAEVQHLSLSYDVAFQSDTDLPTYRLTTHVLPVGQVLVSADQSTGRIHAQNCGQGGNACGNPHEKVCDFKAGWLNAADRHLRCDSYNLALEIPPGEYQFVANVCEITTSAVTNCTTQTVVLRLN